MFVICNYRKTLIPPGKKKVEKKILKTNIDSKIYFSQIFQFILFSIVLPDYTDTLVKTKPERSQLKISIL